MKEKKERKKKQRPFAVFDVETDPFKYNRVPEPFVAEFYDGERAEVFYDMHKAAKFLWNYDGIVYAHNGGKFDWYFFLTYVEPMTDVTIINGRLSKIKFGSAELRDSWNILPIPLADYQKDEIDYAIMEKGEREKPHNKKKIEEYLHMDCVYLHSLVRAFIDRHGIKLTQASASLSECESKIKRKFPRSSSEYYDGFKPYYFGGRVQCFKTGYQRQNVKVYDINSAYPAAMLSKHPFGLEFNRKRGRYLRADYAFDAPHAFFHLRAIARGCFPWREKVGAKNIYPADNEERDYFVTGWEVAAALETGTVNIKQVYEIIEHTDLQDFSDFIVPVFAERKEAKARGDKATDILCKLSANSTYGKTGSDPRNYCRSVFVSPDDIPDLLTGTGLINGRLFYYDGQPTDDIAIASRELEPEEWNFYNVATAASITGHVRATLWRAICASGSVIYCDTDSLVCHDAGKIAEGNELGQWKFEGEFSHWAIVARKIYCLFTDDGWEQDFNAFDLKKRDARKMSLWGKIASKGAVLSSQEILALATGSIEHIDHYKEAPTFSLSKGASFLRREIRRIDY